jgi:hypothetical protein
MALRPLTSKSGVLTKLVHGRVLGAGCHISTLSPVAPSQVGTFPSPINYDKFGCVSMRQMSSAAKLLGYNASTIARHFGINKWRPRSLERQSLLDHGHAGRTIYTSNTAKCHEKSEEKKHFTERTVSSASAPTIMMANNSPPPSDNNESKEKESDIRIEKCPKMELALSMPLSVRESSNEVVFSLAAQGHNDACCEMMRRHIMVTDNVSYEMAQDTLKEIRLVNVGGQKTAAYIHLGFVCTAVSAGIMSFFLVFDMNTVLYFNEHFVTMEVPQASELDTTLEVGAWSWNWMEPPLGQISFFLLCMQFAKGECEFLGIDPIHDWYRHKRAKKLVNKFPQYNSRVLRDFSLSEKYFQRL